MHVLRVSVTCENHWVVQLRCPKPETGTTRVRLAARCYCIICTRARRSLRRSVRQRLQIPTSAAPKERTWTTGNAPELLWSWQGASHPSICCVHFSSESSRAAPVGSSRTPSRTGGSRTATLIRTTAIFMNGQGRARGALSTGSSRQRASTTISCRTDQ